MCLYFIVRLTKPKEEDLKRLLPFVAFVLVSQSIIGILSWSAPQILPSAWLNRAGSRTSGSLDHYSVFTSTIMLCSILLLQSAYNHNLHRTIRLGTIFMFILGVFMIFLSFSRGSWLACCSVIIGLFTLYPKKIMKVGTFAISVFIVLLSAGYLSQQADYAQDRFYSSQSEESALSRLPVVYASLRMLEAKPLLGWGYGDFDKYDYQFQARVGDLVSPKQDHASHNLYLTILAEQGIVGFFFYLMPVVWWLVLSVKAYPKLPVEGFWSRKLLVIFWLVLLFHFIVNNFSNMRVVYGLGLWWITLGFIGVMVSQSLSVVVNPLEVRP
jgi:O-antigen ligase